MKMKAIVKKILLAKTIEKRLRPLYESSESRDEMLAMTQANSVVREALAENNIWLFSQVKSGTTFLCNTLAFYNAACAGIEHNDFDDLVRFGVLRAGRKGHVIEKDRIYDAIEFMRKYDKKLLVHSHNLLSVKHSECILLTRNPFDYCVSSYFYHYKNRDHSAHLSKQKVIPLLINKYALCYHNQKIVADMKKDAYKLTYEDLTTRPLIYVSELIKKIYGKVELDRLKKALELTSVDNLRKWEEVNKKPVLVLENDGFQQKSFVRSGKIGEYKEVFDENEISLIKNLLIENNVPLDGKL